MTETRFKKRAAIGAVAGAAMLAAGVAQAEGVPGQGTWETTLLLGLVAVLFAVRRRAR